MAVLETKYSIAQEAVAQRQVEEVRSLDVANRKLRELENEESRMVMKLRTTQMQQSQSQQVLDSVLKDDNSLFTKLRQRKPRPPKLTERYKTPTPDYSHQTVNNREFETIKELERKIER